jgi:hypothetical protein
VDAIDDPAEGTPVTTGRAGKAGNNGGRGRGHLLYLPVLIKEENRHREAQEKLINCQPVRQAYPTFR